MKQLIDFFFRLFSQESDSEIVQRSKIFADFKMSVPLTQQEIDQLATYNGERQRGLIHNDVYRKKMELLQERFYLEQKQIAGLGAMSKREFNNVLSVRYGKRVAMRGAA